MSLKKLQQDREDLQNHSQSNLYVVLDKYVNTNTINRRNEKKKWAYGYDSEYDMVVISKTGRIGEIVSINGLVIALPEEPSEEKIKKRSSVKKDQYWEREPVPKELQKIRSIFEWDEYSNEFKNSHIPYINDQFDYRENGYWFYSNGKPIYITGSHWFYLQWACIDVGYPDYREANRIFFIFWEACKADNRCFGMAYVKIRRSGFSFMESSECINVATSTKKARVGILSKTGDDAKKMFTLKVVPINTKLPFFFKPIMDGMDKPKSELLYQVPATRLSKKKLGERMESKEYEGMDSSIDWKNTDNNAYDGEKLTFLAHDESSKWLRPNNIEENWRVTKTCLRLGSRIIGKCMMGSTVNAMKNGGSNYKKLINDSNILNRNENGQTKSGLYALFIPMEWNMEGFIDKYGMPVFRAPKEPIIGINNELIKIGAIDYWEGEVNSLKNDSEALNEYYRQFPRTLAHAFRDESQSSLFNLTKIYQQIDYNDSLITSHHLTRGNFMWKDGIKDTKVIWSPDKKGRFLINWMPPPELQNKIVERGGQKYPMLEHIGAFGCDPYDISAVVDGRGSNGSLHGLTKFHMESKAPTNTFFLEYICRPQMAEIFFEDVLMACVFYGMPILIENNKTRLLYHFKNRGYRPFSLNRPDKHGAALSKTERELGGIPNSSTDVIQAHASAIEMYIEKYVGYDTTGVYRDTSEIGSMLFNNTLADWAIFDITDRSKHDASISSGLAIMANNKQLYQPERKESKICIKFAQYENFGYQSELR